MSGLLALKVLVIVGVTLASIAGVWAPLYWSRSRRPTSALQSRGGDVLSLCNCLSAGMLLANALGHFFPDAFEVSCTTTEVSRQSAWLLAGILFPAVLNRLCPGGHSHEGLNAVSSRNPPSLFASNALMLLVLMCFHFTTEGMLVGVEGRSAALLAIVIPLSIHRFFDGVVVGVALAKEKEEQQALRSPYEPAATGELTVPRRTVSAAEWSADAVLAALPTSHRVAVVAWLAVTPVAFVVTELLQPRDAFPSGAAEVGHNHSGGTSTPFGHSTSLSAMKSFGSGSFIFVALELLAEEELKGLLPSVALLVGVAFALFLLFLSPGEGH